MAEDNGMTERPADLEALYDQYGTPLEGEHWGKYVAIAYDGRTIIGQDLHGVAMQASAVFGPGNVIFKVGPRSVGRIR